MFLYCSETHEKSPPSVYFLSRNARKTLAFFLNFEVWSQGGLGGGLRAFLELATLRNPFFMEILLRFLELEDVPAPLSGGVSDLWVMCFSWFVRNARVVS